ncbi:DUF362 domain-containing protein [Patescibacteria group bacterium]
MVDEIGGFKRYIEKGDVVLLKPNFNTADSFPASSDPKFLRDVIELIYEYGAKEVIIGDSCTFSQNTCKVMEKIGVFDFKDMNPAPRIVIFDDHKWVKKSIPEAKYLKTVSVPEVLDKVDKLVLLPCLKTHFMAQFTGSLKLSVGFMKPIERLPLHARKLQEKIADLNKVIHPDLIIMDGRKCFINKGPSDGEVREPNLLLASTDRKAIDIEGVKIIQGHEGNSLSNVKAEEMVQIRNAMEAVNSK